MSELLGVLIILLILFYFLAKNRRSENTILIKRGKGHKRNDRNRIKDLDFGKEDREIIFRKFDNRCFNCGSRKNLTIDHHYPLEKGYGLKSAEGTYNAVLLCSRCNRNKSNKMPENFYDMEKLKVLEEKYGLKKQEEKQYDIYHLTEERAFIEFSYLGKNYEGRAVGILEEEIKLLGVKNKIYLELESGEKKLVFPLKGVKNIKKIKEPVNGL